MSEYLLSPQIIFAAAGIAAGSVCVIAVGLLTARVWRRSVPIRHGILLASLAAAAVSPLVITAGAWCGFGWNIDLELPALPVAETAGATAVSSAQAEGPAPEIYVSGDELIAQLRADRPVVPTAKPISPARTSASALETIRIVGTTSVAVWLLGAAVMLLRGLRAHARLRRLRNSLSHVTSPCAMDALQRACAHLPLPNKPRLICGPHVPTPFCLGLLRPAIAIPSKLVQSQEEGVLESILIHECAHIARRDLWIGLLQQILGVLYWWNPLVHRAAGELADLREELCDSYVLARLADRRSYAAALVEFAAGLASGPPTAAVGLFSRRKHRLEGRVQRILEEDRPMKATLGFMAKAMLVLFVFALGAASMLLLVKSPELFVSEMSAADRNDMFVSVEPAVTWAELDRVANSGNTASNQMSSLSDMAYTDMPAHEEAAATQYDNAIAWESDTYGLDEPATPAAQPLPAAPIEFEADSQFFPPDSPEPLLPDQPAASAAADDSFTQPSSFSPPPAADAPALDPFAPATRAEVPKRGLVLVELLGNEDGSLKQLRYLTEDLGNDESAFEQLDERIQEWKKQFTDGVDTEVHLAADSSLRYEHVMRAVQVCNQYVTRIVFAKPTSEQHLTVTVGYVRDAAGNKVINSPVVFWGEQLVVVDKLAEQLNSLRQSTGDLSAFTVLIRADTEVPVDVIEKIIRQGQAAGLENFALRRLTPEAPEVTGTTRYRIHVTGQVVVFDEDNQIAHLSIGSDDGVRPHMTLTVSRKQDDSNPRERFIGHLEIVRVSADTCEARVILLNDLQYPIEVGDEVTTKSAEPAGGGTPSDHRL